jgi:hypothetical protein
MNTDKIDVAETTMKAQEVISKINEIIIRDNLSRTDVIKGLSSTIVEIQLEQQNAEGIKALKEVVLDTIKEYNKEIRFSLAFAILGDYVSQVQLDLQATYGRHQEELENLSKNSKMAKA